MTSNRVKQGVGFLQGTRHSANLRISLAGVAFVLHCMYSNCCRAADEDVCLSV